MNLNGGWEGWAQVEIALRFVSYGYPVEREVNVFESDPKKRADLVLYLGPGLQVALEVKTQSKDRDVTVADEDLTKLVENKPTIPAGQMILGRTDWIETLYSMTEKMFVNFKQPKQLWGKTPNDLAWMIVYL